MIDKNNNSIKYIYKKINIKKLNKFDYVDEVNEFVGIQFEDPNFD